MTDEIDWFISFRSSPQYTLLKKRPIVYFCAEYALSDTIPIYAGGLGVLAGDYIREAVDQQIPFIAVGLYYNESVNSISPDKLGLNPVVDNSGKRLTVEVPIAERTVYVRAWTKKIGSINVYLLDTCFEENSIPDQKITSRLYVADAETRLKQQIILGIGGLRVIEALGIHPIVYHMNEGHSAMLATELVRHEMSERKIGFPEAKRYIRNRLVFTNHTLVPAGNDLFTDDMVSALLRKYAEEIEIPVHELIELGRVGESSMFSNTLFSLRMADKVNTVSKIHAKKAAEIWHDHPMESITNGIHLSSWDRIGTTDFIWEDHQRNKEKLLDLIKKETGQVWSKNNLLLGWARRMTNYKRPLAILENMDRFIQIAKKK